MKIEFINSVPGELEKQAVIISGEESVNDNVEYLVLTNNDLVQKVFQIHFEYHCSPFKNVLLKNNLLAIGHQGHFYLYDLSENASLLALKMDGYFGNLYENDNLFYVASSGSIYCINERGNLIWINADLGVDGVLIERFTENRIYGIGQCNPPDGWRAFILKISTGKLIPN